MQGNGAAAAAAAAGAMAIGPTPAGHQAELNIIYGHGRGAIAPACRQSTRHRRDRGPAWDDVRNRARETGAGQRGALGRGYGRTIWCVSSTFSLVYFLSRRFSLPGVGSYRWGRERRIETWETWVRK